MKTFYITTAIDYPNGAPHMGHAYEKLVTDTYARWYRFMDYEAYFLTGTDENGQKLVKAAEEADIDTKIFVDRQADVFRKLCQDLRISNNDFIRTTEDRHIKVAQEIWSTLEKKGDIYPGEYEGLYCISCETFYTNLQAPDGICPVHQSSLEKVKEKGFFFRLSKFAKWIDSHIENTKSFVVPNASRIEILNRLRAEEVRDLSVSRPNAGWGIPVPGHKDFVMYTWFDALINYVSGVKSKGLYDKLWPADVHVIGKDITWFHSVIWPCMLHAADLPLPQQIYVHGMVLGEDGKKMSKTLGNGVDPYEIIEKFPNDSFRYYILRAIPSGMDGAFVRADLKARHNQELANDYGNLLMRVSKLGAKKLGERIDPEGMRGEFDFRGLCKKMHKCMENREHHRALEALWGEVNRVNGYMNDNEPWKLGAGDKKFKEVIYNGLYSLHCFGSLIGSFLPHSGQKTLEILGTTNEGPRGLEFGKHSFHLRKIEALFPKME